jgi:hypothetical protein
MDKLDEMVAGGEDEVVLSDKKRRAVLCKLP